MALQAVFLPEIVAITIVSEESANVPLPALTLPLIVLTNIRVMAVAGVVPRRGPNSPLVPPLPHIVQVRSQIMVVVRNVLPAQKLLIVLARRTHALVPLVLMVAAVLARAQKIALIILPVPYAI